MYPGRKFWTILDRVRKQYWVMVGATMKVCFAISTDTIYRNVAIKLSRLPVADAEI